MMKYILLATGILISTSVLAHDAWLERQGTIYTLYYGHQGNSHGGAKQIEYSPKSVLTTTCWNQNGQTVPVTASSTYPVKITGECALLHVTTSSGYWSKTPFGTQNIPKNEAKMPIKSWQSFENIKRIDAWHESFAQSLTQEFELVPLQNPFELKVDDKLSLRVFFQGKPLAGVSVAYEGKSRGETDNEGHINIRLKHNGFQVVQASYTVPTKTDKADEIVYTTHFLFEIP